MRPCLILLLLAAAPLFAAEPAGFQTKLLNGENTHGWQITGCVVNVENGSLVIKDGNGLVRSDSRYRDFILELEYRPLQKDKYDAGIYIRCELPPDGKPWPSQYQVNLKHGDELNLIGFPQARSTGLIKPGEWNHVKLTIVGDKAQMKINGRPAWETTGIEARDGYVGIQVEVPGGGQFEFKEITVTELGYTPLFDGASLAGWEGAGEPAEKCWQVEEGSIVCTGDKGPWLRSKEQHGDYNLRLDYKLKAGGNSGVFIRVPEDGDHHGDGAGIEVQVVDDNADKHQGIKPYQFGGSLYAIAPATKRVGRPVGEWNSLEINCHGKHYRIIHNGQVIVDVDASHYPELNGRLTKGFLGLQNHSERVWFRNLRIGPAYDLPPPARPADPTAAQIKELLQQPILATGTPQAEVEAFCEARVLRLPAADAAERKSPAAWQAYMAEVRKNVLERVVFRGEAAQWKTYRGQVETFETIEAGDAYTIKKLRFEAVPGLWVPALLYEPTKIAGKVPVFLNVNGHDGQGKSADYKQIRCINLAKRGIISLNLEWFGMGQLRGPGFTHYKLNQLDLCGTSGVAPFYLAMQRGLDILLAHPRADPERVGVAGLSGGGWQTIFIGSLDPRVTLANPVAGYSSYLTRIHHHSDLGDSEQTPVDLAATGDYAHLTAMLAPRVALLTYNEKDNCCFAAPHALPPLLAAARPAYRLLDRAGALHEHINYDPGTHNFERDNREALYKVIGQHWFADQPAYSGVEIECSGEVLSAERLAVELPAGNLDFQKLAEQLMKDLPAKSSATRDEVRQVLRLADGSEKLKATAASHAQLGLVTATRWQLRIDDAWTVPAVEFSAGGSGSAAIVLADEGRAAAAEEVSRLLAAGTRVVAIDPFYLGESKIKSRDFLFALLVSSVGERPLGVQVHQLERIAAWLKADPKTTDVRIHAVGPRTSLMALAAAAAAEENIGGVRLTGSLGSLKEVIEQGGQVDRTPEQFCFGLLATADIAQLAALVAPRPVQLPEPSERVKKELAGLADVYSRLGQPFDPLAP
ncbi:MAG: family 16 glycoside hydrolase [Pirellulaceae bacterium]